MFFTSFLQRRVSSLLQPYLLEQPTLTLTAGFFSSHVVATDLRLDPSILNQFLNESCKFCFQEVVIEYVGIRFRYWSFPAFQFDVRGVHVTLAPREETGRVQKFKGSSKLEFKEALAAIDPESSALHDMLERISTITSKNRVQNSVSNLALKHCRLVAHGVHLHVNLPLADDHSWFFLEVEEINVESELLEHRCFLKGLATAMCLPLEDSSFVFECKGVEAGFKRTDGVNHFFGCRDISTCITLKELQITEFDVSVPEARFSFSPTDLPLLLVVNEYLSREKSGRSGGQLWDIVRSKKFQLVSTPSLSLRKLVQKVGLWMRYVSTCEQLLRLIGYSATSSVKRSTIKMVKDKKFSSAVKSCWLVISEIEKELVTESISRALCIARYRAFLDGITIEDGPDKAIDHLNLLWILVQLPVLIWKIICTIVLWILGLRVLLQRQDIEHAENPSEESSLYSFGLKLGTLSIYIDPIDADIPHIDTKWRSYTRMSQVELLSFCILFGGVILRHESDICQKRVSAFCGNFKIMSSSLMEASRNDSGKDNNFVKQHWQDRGTEFQTILHSEPVELLSIVGDKTTGKHIEGAYFLQKVLEDLWSTWTRFCLTSDESETRNSEKPFFLFELENSLRDSSSEDPVIFCWKCSTIVGKLKLALDFSSIFSIALILNQVENVHSSMVLKRNETIRLSSVNRFNSTADRYLVTNYSASIGKIKMAIAGSLRDRCLQIGVLITGPSIEVSLRNDYPHRGKKYFRHVTGQDLHISVNVCNIEAAIWPSSKQELTSSAGKRRSNDNEKGCYILKDPQTINIPKPDNMDFVSCGRISFASYIRLDVINGSFKIPTRDQQCELFVLNPILLELSAVREYVTAFESTIISYLITSHGLATGFSISLYTDELETILKVLAYAYSVLSDASTRLHSLGLLNRQKLVKKDVISPEPDNDTIVKRPFTCSDILFSINASVELKSVTIIVHSFREMNSVNISKSMRYLSDCDMSDSGIMISTPQQCIGLLFEEEKLELSYEISGIQILMFKYQSQNGKTAHQSEFTNQPYHSLDCIYEASASKCIMTMLYGVPQNVASFEKDSASVNKASYSEEEFPSTVEMSSSQSFTSQQKMVVTSLLIKFELSEAFITGCPVKVALLNAHRSDRILSSLSCKGGFQHILLCIQGGCIFLEGKALVMICGCFVSHLHCVRHLLSEISLPVEEADPSRLIASRNANFPEEYGLHIPTTSEQAKLKDFSFNLSEFSLVFLNHEESGRLRELVFQADVNMKLELENTKKLLFTLSRFLVSSQILCTNAETDIGVPILSSIMSNDGSSDLLSRGFTRDFELREEIQPALDSSSSSNPASTSRHLGFHSYILEHLSSVILVEKPELNQNNPPSSSAWIGSCSVTGCELTISLSEIQCILSMAESFSEVIDRVKVKEMSQGGCFNQDSGNSLSEAVPDGSIVAIQDVNQHLYFSVESEENKHRISGAIHYSLVGERALFRVKYQKQRKWKLGGIWFSLISLYAKNNLGEPLRLNYHPGIDFLDISSNNDDGWALWEALPYRRDSYEDDLDWEAYNKLAKNLVYLVNKKNDCSIAFVDGIPEFVGKPGNPIKFKVFHDLSLAQSVKVMKSNFVEGSTNDESCNLPVVESAVFPTQSLPSIDINFEKIVLTIVHELPDRNDKFLLLRGCIDKIVMVVQILPAKTRVICTLTAMLSYFDAQKSLWRELVPPVEVCTYYRSNLQVPAADTGHTRVPMGLYCRLNRLDVNLTMLSLDILLFAVGELNLVGPYSVKSSRILANCCKVENQVDIDCICHFYDNQHITIARKHSASVYLRPQAGQSTPFVSIQLVMFGAFSTVPISLYEDKALAWRTRIVSLQDSRTYPGPFIIADISRGIEDGLAIMISPLIRIHNITEFPIELRFERPQQKESEMFSVVLEPGDTFDDCRAVFDALSLSGGAKRTLMSLSVGNFLFSFRPQVTYRGISCQSMSVEWSDCLKGGKAVRLSGLLGKLSYRIRKAFSVDPVKCSFTTTHCSVKSEGVSSSNMHFLIQTIGRDVPVIHPERSNDSEDRNLPIALQEQKEIFLLPTVRVLNLLQSEVLVLLTDKNTVTSLHQEMGNQATIPSGSNFDFFINPAIIHFTFTLTARNLSCKPVNSSDWVKRLQKQKKAVYSLDIELDFGSASASLRLSREHRGMLEVTLFTSYTLRNDTDSTLYFIPFNQKPLSRNEVQEFGSSFPLELGLVLPPKSTGSWFSKSNKIFLKLLEENSCEELLDLDALSGLTEIGLKREDECGIVHVTKLGVSLAQHLSKVVVPLRTVILAPRYLIVNDSKEAVVVRQCHLEDDMEGVIQVDSEQKATLQLRHVTVKRKQTNLFDKLINKHKNILDESSIHVQFQLRNSGHEWSGPVCIASLGRFFLKFRKSLDIHGGKSDELAKEDNNRDFAAVHVVQDGSTLVMHFQKPPNTNLPYRIENMLHFAVGYYQKDSSDPEILGSESSIDYVWDDTTRPHKLLVQISDMHLLREINLDKLRPWKPFSKSRHKVSLARPLVLEKMRTSDININFGKPADMEMAKVGYEVWADGPTRVLRICEYSRSHGEQTNLLSMAKRRLRVSSFAIHFLEDKEQDSKEPVEQSVQMPIIIARLGNMNLDSLLTDQHNYCRIKVQWLNVEQKLAGSPFASMARRHQMNLSDTSDCIFRLDFILLSTSSRVKQVKYSSIVLQPIDLNLDEETLMRLAPFWRTSVSDSSTPSRQFYFDHFEIHPIKVIMNFVPGDSYSSYSTTQETLRSLLHSVIKVPAMRNVTVELNGVLITHALITTRELFIKCAQHYSWYMMRAVYIAKGSPLLPPVFSSIFDDLASSSLDVFFDPSRGLMGLPGLTMGTFKLISKCIDAKGFSGTKRYFGDLVKTLRTAGSNVLFATVTEISDSVLRGAETNGVQGMVSGFHQGILRLAMEPLVLGAFVIEGGPDRKIKLDRSPGVDELYIEGYLQAMLDTIYKQEYLRVRVIDDQVFLKNLPPSSSLIDEIMDRVKGFLISKALLKGDSSISGPLRQLRGEREWKIGPTVLTLCEHLFVSFAIRTLRKQAGNFVGRNKSKESSEHDGEKSLVPVKSISREGGAKTKFSWKWGISKFVLSGIIAYIDGRLCRCIPNPIARRIVSGFLLSFVDNNG